MLGLCLWSLSHQRAFCTSAAVPKMDPSNNRFLLRRLPSQRIPRQTMQSESSNRCETVMLSCTWYANGTNGLDRHEAMAVCIIHCGPLMKICPCWYWPWTIPKTIHYGTCSNQTFKVLLRHRVMCATSWQAMLCDCRLETETVMLLTNSNCDATKRI